jgi:hypothetical protein
VTTTRLRLRLTKSETRDLADRELAEIRRIKIEEWRVGNATFFIVFVVVAAALAIAALLLG